MASKEYYDVAYGLRDLAKELNRSDVIDTIDSEIKKMKFDELGKNVNYSYISKTSKTKEENKDKYKPSKTKTIFVTEKLEDEDIEDVWYNDDWTIDDEESLTESLLKENIEKYKLKYQNKSKEDLNKLFNKVKKEVDDLTNKINKVDVIKAQKLQNKLNELNNELTAIQYLYQNKKQINEDIEKHEEDEFNNELSFNDFLNEAEVILVDNAFDFDINEWEKENQEEINEELSEDINNVKNTATSQFIKYQLTPDKVKEIVNKIINSEFNIINYWKTNQFKKKNNLTDDDLKDILKTLTEQDYKANSVSVDNSKNEAIIFIKQTNIKNLNNIKVYIKLDYDSIENSPVIVLSFHNKRQKTQLISSYKNIGSLKEEIKDEDDYLDKLDLKSNGIYSLNTGWVKHPIQQDIPDIDMDEFEKEFKVWEDKYFDLLDKESSKEEIDNLLEDIYNLRQEGMKEENGEYSIPNLIFKEFRNLGYLDNLKELRKKEINKELSLENLNNNNQLTEDIGDVLENQKESYLISSGNYVLVASIKNKKLTPSWVTSQSVTKYNQIRFLSADDAQKFNDKYNLEGNVGKARSSYDLIEINLDPTIKTYINKAWFSKIGSNSLELAGLKDVKLYSEDILNDLKELFNIFDPKKNKIWFKWN